MGAHSSGNAERLLGKQWFAYRPAEQALGVPWVSQ
jgi:hypothetical protein